MSARLRAWAAIQKRVGRPRRKGTNLADADMAERVGDVDIEAQSLDARAEAETQSSPGNGAPPAGAVLGQPERLLGMASTWTANPWVVLPIIGSSTHMISCLLS
jgi:hypothetical protein